MEEAEKIREEIRRRIDAGVELQAWEKLDEETDMEYKYFTYYLKLAPRNRTLKNAVSAFRTDAGKPNASGIPGAWINAKKEFDWDNRVKLYDQYMKQDLRNYVEHEQYSDLIKFRRRQRELAELITKAAFSLVERAMEALDGLNADELAPSTIANYIKTATQVADFAHNLEAQGFALNKILEKLNSAETSEIEELLVGIDFESLEETERLLTSDIFDFDEDS